MARHPVDQVPSAPKLAILSVQHVLAFYAGAVIVPLLIAQGLSNSEIEAELGITRATCRSHITALLARLGARDRAQLVIAAYESGLVSAR